VNPSSVMISASRSTVSTTGSIRIASLLSGQASRYVYVDDRGSKSCLKKKEEDEDIDVGGLFTVVLFSNKSNLYYSVIDTNNSVIYNINIVILPTNNNFNLNIINKTTRQQHDDT
jgi:hypothetical protein